MQRRKRHAVFLTYTMAHPFAIGVFFRALRLSRELHERGWQVTVCNTGTLPQDPKIEMAAAWAKIVSLEPPDQSEIEVTAYSYEVFRSLGPDLMVMGEEPFPGMLPFYHAARQQPAPFVVLDQYYEDEIHALRHGVDRILLYGLRSLWPEPPPDRAGFFAIIPPFIDDITPVEALPVPEALHNQPWVTILGFDKRVLRGGLDLLARLPTPQPVVVTISHEPAIATGRMTRAGIDESRQVALPLQPDPDLFGLIAHSRAVILANGFMQLMEALALECPAIAIHRGIGMGGWSLDDTFVPFVSIEETRDEQLTRLQAWLCANPFTEAQRTDLARERHGTRVCVDHLESIARRPSVWRRLQRMGSRFHGHRQRRQRWRAIGARQAPDLVLPAATNKATLPRKRHAQE